ncbi:mismatch-specific DNA-glycosylase [Priestia filamentosa]|uniref:mismatch-specific DNA-glycosylase n=1 Tax=Priestia filamentosa TaxID=1402861 RepID=UPI0039828FA4
MEKVADYLKEDLDILFVGFNPSIRSGNIGHHFAHPSNRFWTILEKAKLTPRKLHPTEDYKLLDFNYGLTNIVSRPTKGAEDIAKEEYKEGREELRRKINKFKPKIACFVGKGVYQEYRNERKIPWGIQGKGVVEGTIDFVAPSSSGLVRMSLEEIVAIYRELNHILKHLHS